MPKLHCKNSKVGIISYMNCSSRSLLFHCSHLHVSPEKD